MKQAKKIITKEVMLYVIFGLLTTFVNIGVFYFLRYLVKWNENISNLIAIITSIVVAYITNKNYVFHSKANSTKEKMKEFLKFITGRILTMLLEFLGGLLLFETDISEIASKIFLTAIVIILNYFMSKFFAFSNGKK